MNKEAIIIFLKYPELGRSKTRLAATIGNEKALKVYKELLSHTNLISKELNSDKYLFYDKVTANKMPWGDDIYHTAYQLESNLGGRMQNAFEKLFEKGYERIVIIGSDCYDLTQEIIEEAFEKLKNKEVIIGPAKDGGYYLLGLTKLIPQLFTDVAWSTDEVFSATIKALDSLDIAYDTTAVLSDIDVYEDLPEKLKLLIR
ncbi:MAG: TIGR04282 family arsenosugar biosynthesis glycosyltransferase [Bacteroidetes bacterium]|nr:TIGR04282 family arsenosugar biosynthesis glycosyltransferase [Bacteroidota bacterium]MBU1372788.1 TIGR04282 family arsenosugar biosynthesis glycosyltransferase [Bacteroidota bacterium]MBU1484984.1 TIGR04282 family arsenosugar biosynthesis glycosyltransferase [Bacteroidota bacterium]MBU1761823.1 TIGR04282 family arsenosugar biosynthesis glycosyltransferase [Bacteroidota bacterium]MBU2045383.1 TIGR04282 family arsenosugar biosynthesis glycosyltransferase [Bacteroidota bacterium]